MNAVFFFQRVASKAKAGDDIGLPSYILSAACENLLILDLSAVSCKECFDILLPFKVLLLRSYW